MESLIVETFKDDKIMDLSKLLVLNDVVNLAFSCKQF